MAPTAQISVYFALQMCNPKDKVVSEAAELVRTTRVAHRVFVSIFLNQEAVGEIAETYQQKEAGSRDEKLSFVSLYFGSSQGTLGDCGPESNPELDVPKLKRHISSETKSPGSRSHQKPLSGLELTQQMIEDNFFQLEALKSFKAGR